MTLLTGYLVLVLLLFALWVHKERRINTLEDDLRRMEAKYVSALLRPEPRKHQAVVMPSGFLEQMNQQSQRDMNAMLAQTRSDIVNWESLMAQFGLSNPYTTRSLGPG